MTRRTVFMVGVLAEVFGGFLSCVANAGDLCTAPDIISLSPLPLAHKRDWREHSGLVAPSH